MTRSSSTHHRYRPSFEALETRLTPAVTFQRLDLDGDGVKDDIRIVGDNQNTRITIVDFGADHIDLTIDANGDGDLDDTALGDRKTETLGFAFKSGVYGLKLGGGADQVIYTMDRDYDASAVTLRAQLGTGNDLFQFNAAGHAVTNGSALRFNIAAGGGADGVQLGFASVSDSSLTIRSHLGAGDDNSAIGITGNIDFGASADIDVALGTGDNNLDVDLQGVGLLGVATVNIDIVGGDDARHRDDVDVFLRNDVGNGQVASLLAIRANLFAGKDEFQVELDRSDVRIDDGSTCKIVAHGGAGNDFLNAFTAGLSGTLPVDPGALLDVRLFGDAGIDEISLAFTSFGAEPALQLLGNLRARVNGGAGNDDLSLNMQNNDSSTGNYDLALFGGAGSDFASFRLEQNLGTPTFEPGLAILNGGAGKDFLSNDNPAVTQVKQFEIFV